MSDLTAQTVSVDSLPVITYQDQPVMTTELLARCYGTDVKNIQMNYTNNKDRFDEGKHYFKLEGDALRHFKSLHRPNEIGSVGISPRVKALTLWTERGAARHAKMLDTDQAWEVFEKLEDAYFGVGSRKPLTPAEMILAQAQQLVSIEREQARTAQRVNALEHRVELMDGDTGYLTVTAYVRREGWRLPLSKMREIGQRAARAAKDLGVNVGTVPDERFGTVNSYPIALLDEVVTEFFGSSAAA